MIKFHQIPTEKYKPLSHDKAYLFNMYDKIANFLAFNLDSDKNYKNKIAKPVRNNENTDFYSPFPNLTTLDELENKNQILHEYWLFKETIQNKIEALNQSKDENHKDWAKILEEVFDDKNNVIFSNGNEFSIIWGWEFENRKNFKPSLIDLQPKKVDETNKYDTTEDTTEDINELNEDIIEKENVEEPTSPNEPLDDNDDEILIDEPKESIEEEIEFEEELNEIEEINPNKPNSFLEFLKWFASNYWWILLVLGALVIIVFFVKSLKY